VLEHNYFNKQSQGIFRPSRRCEVGEVGEVSYVTVVATQKAGK